MDYLTFTKQGEHLSTLPIEEFIQKDGIADEFMKKRHGQIKINQLRNFFSEIKSIKPENFSSTNKARLEMSLAYDYGRNVITNDFYDLVTKLLSKINIENKKEDFKQFFEMVQALIAYHKYHSKQS